MENYRDYLRRFFQFFRHKEVINEDVPIIQATQVEQKSRKSIVIIGTLVVVAIISVAGFFVVKEGLFLTNENKGDVYSSQGDFAKAAEFYRSALQKNPESVAIMKKLAFVNAADIQYSYGKALSGEAMAVINNAIALDPNNSENYRIKGYVEEVSLDCKLAIESYKKAIELDSTNEAAYSGLGHCYSYLGDKENAIEFYSKAYELNPNNGFAALSFALHVLIRNNEYEEAIPYLEVAIKNLTDKRLKAEALTLRGEIAAQQKSNFEETISFFDRAIQTDETYSRAYVGKCKNIFLNITQVTKFDETQASQIDECFNLLNKANQVNPQDASASYWQGVLLRLGSRNDLAEGVLRDGLNRISQDVTLWTSTDKTKLMGSIYYELAALYSVADKPDVAIINLRKALILNPDLSVNLAQSYNSPLYFQKIKDRSDFEVLLKTTERELY